MAESSKMKLAAAIRALPGYALPLANNPLQLMAARAEAGYYHDYESPLATPCIQLATDLRAVGAEAILARHMNGEFDATMEESDAWAASPDGQEAFAMLIGDRK